MPDKRANLERQLARVAIRQHGVVAAWQLRAIGLDKDAISHRSDVGRLHRVHRGVYAVGHNRLSFEGRCFAAVLACAGAGPPGGRGPSAGAGSSAGQGPPADLGRLTAISHRSAAPLWGMLP